MFRARASRHSKRGRSFLSVCRGGRRGLAPTALEQEPSERHPRGHQLHHHRPRQAGRGRRREQQDRGQGRKHAQASEHRRDEEGMVQVDDVGRRPDPFHQGHARQEPQAAETGGHADQDGPDGSRRDGIDRGQGVGEDDVPMKALRHDETRRGGDQRQLGLQEPAKPVDADAPQEERQEVGGIAQAEDVRGQERPYQ